MFSKEFIQEMKIKLVEAKSKLEQELAGLPSHTELGSGQDENAEEVEIDEANQDVKSRISKDLEKISIALAKIENGNYGIDSEGKEISEERLRAIPWADKAI